MTRMSKALALVLMAGAAPGLAQQTAPPAAPAAVEIAPPAASPAPADTIEELDTALDHAGRMTVPVFVNGQGPFQFTLDSGADRTVVSDRLAKALALPAGPTVNVHDIAGEQKVATALVTRLQVGSREIKGIAAPVFVLNNLGAVGMLGIDSVADQRVLMDFKTHRLAVEASAGDERSEPGTIVVRGKRRFGQLVLVDSRFRGRKVYVIVDTGSQTSVGNLAFRRVVTRKLALDRVDIVSVTGRKATGDQVMLPEMELGEVTLRDVPIVFADLHTFRRFGIDRQPAMLLGMDVLRAFERVSVDFVRKRARFRVKR